LDGELAQSILPPFETMLTEARRVLDDPPTGAVERDLQLLQANLDTWLGQLRSPDPDVVIIERAAARVMAIVKPSVAEVADVFEASGLGPDAAEVAAELLDRVVEAAGELGAANELDDVRQANVVSEKQAELERYVGEHLPARPNEIPTVNASALSKADRMKEARVKGWEKFWSDTLPDHAGKIVVASAGGIAAATGKLGAIMNVIKALLKFFA
jgi:hypothetical protein